MIWICVEYSDGTRVHHIFRGALIYTMNGKIHVHGRTLCDVEFSHDTSGARTDVISPLILGVDTDLRLVPMDHCHACQLARLRVRRLYTDRDGDIN